MKKLIILLFCLWAIQAHGQQMLLLVGGDTEPFDYSQYDTLLYDWNPISTNTADSSGAAINNNEGIGFILPGVATYGDTIKQTTAGAYPKWKETGGPNSTPSVYHDGTDDQLTEVSTSYWNCDSITFYLVMKRIDSDNLFQHLFAKGVSSSNKCWAFGKGNNSVTYGPYGADMKGSKDGSSVSDREIWRDASLPTAWGLVTIKADHKLDNQEFWLDGVEVTLQGYQINGTQGFYDTSAKFEIGDGGDFGSDGVEWEWARLLIYAGYHTTAQREAIESALSDEYNLGL